MNDLSHLSSYLVFFCYLYIYTRNVFTFIFRIFQFTIATETFYTHDIIGLYEIVINNQGVSQD